MTIEDRLRALDLFRDLPEESFQMLASCAVEHRFRAGQSLWAKGERIKAFHVVGSGQVKMFHLSPEGREQILYLFGPGEPFCFCSAFDEDRTMPANAAAVDDCSIFVFPWSCLEEVSNRDAGLLFRIVQLLSRRLKQTMALVESLALREIPGRVALFLLQGTAQGQDRLHLTVSHRELAKMLGTTPETLSRTLKKMAGMELVRTEGREIRILDRSRLEELAGEEGEKRGDRR